MAKKNKEFVVVYKINIDATSPLEAALLAEKYMKELIYRPHFYVIDENNNSVSIDLHNIRSK